MVFGGFSAQSIADRLTDAQAGFIVTSDGAFRGNKEIGLKSVIDDALVQCRFVKRVIVLTRTRTPSKSMIKGRDVWWEDEIRKVETMGNPDCPAEEMDAEDPFVHLYFRIHRKAERRRAFECGLYGVHTYSFANVFQYRPGEIFFCTADIGWITGHSYIVYGPLGAGITSLMFEGFHLARTLEGFGISSTSTT